MAKKHLRKSDIDRRMKYSMTSYQRQSKANHWVLSLMFDVWMQKLFVKNKFWMWFYATESVKWKLKYTAAQKAQLNINVWKLRWKMSDKFNWHGSSIRWWILNIVMSLSPPASNTLYLNVSPAHFTSYSLLLPNLSNHKMSPPSHPAHWPLIGQPPLPLASDLPTSEPFTLPCFSPALNKSCKQPLKIKQ